jgi:hypothetical protein
VLACCPTAWVDGFRVAHGAAAGVGGVGVINWKGVRGTTGIAKLEGADVAGERIRHGKYEGKPCSALKCMTSTS